MEIKDLKKEIPYKWKIQAKPNEKEKKMGICVAHIDSRACQDLLDEIVGEENRQTEFFEIKWKLFCKVWIRINNERIYKQDSWALEPSDKVDEETTSKWESSDAFKRACVHRWIGRFLYDLPVQYISEKDFTKYKFKLTEFCNNNIKKEITKPDFLEDNFDKFKIYCETLKSDEELQKAFNWLQWKYKVSDDMQLKILDLLFSIINKNVK